jgi:hypothetical protein
LDQELFDLIGVIVSVVLELVRVELVLQLLWNVDNYVISVSSLLDNVSVACVSKSESVSFGVCNLVERVLQFGFALEEADDTVVVISNELVEVSNGLELLGGWTSLEDI